MTRIEDVVARVVTVLDGAGKPAGLTVHRNRSKPLRDDTLPAIVVYVMGFDEERHETGAGTTWMTEVALECRAAASATESADQALDPLLEWAVSSLRQDSTLMGMIDDMGDLRAEYQTEAGEHGDRGALGIVVPLLVDSLWNNPAGAF